MVVVRPDSTVLACKYQFIAGLAGDGLFEVFQPFGIQGNMTRLS